MQIKKGTWRIVLLIPALGIAIKFPRIYCHKAFGNFKRILKNKIMRHHEIYDFSVYTPGSFKQWMFWAIMVNWLEWRFYQKYHHQFCVPTYFSFFGFLNVQQLVSACKMDRYDFCQQFQFFPNCQPLRANHHFTNPENFTLDSGKLQILDYGDPKAQGFILEVGDLVQSRFDPNFSWKKYLQEQKARKNK